MESNDFKLPGASLAELEKIIEAFSQKGGPASNDEIAKLAGLSATTVSRCNGFLISTNIIDGGNKKEVTQLGKKLGLALHHDQQDEIKKFWTEVVSSNSFLSEQVTAIRVQKAVKEDELAPKILYNSGAKKNKYSEIGSRTVVAILVRAGLLVENDGLYTVSKAGPVADEEPLNKPDSNGADENKLDNDGGGVVETKGNQVKPHGKDSGIQFAVNIQLHIQEFEDTSKYEDLFKALRKHLMPEHGAE